MTIDWITVSAQIVNFLVLVWLLRRFLYQPVMRAMERREQRIAVRLSDAQEREQQAEEQIKRYQDKTEEMQRKQDEIFANAKEQAEQQKHQMLREARDEVAETREHWQRQANQEKQEFLNNLRHQATDAIEAIARKALIDLADAELEQQVVESFIQRLKSLDITVRKAISDTIEPVRIVTTFELDSTVRSRLTRAVHEHLIEGIEVEYSRSPELLCGIELTSGGRRLSWNLADYLEQLTARVEEAFVPTEPAKD